MEFYHYEHVLYYHIKGTALNYIAEHGISKLRCGYDNLYRAKVYRRNEFGIELTEAYKKILERMSPDYVPPKKALHPRRLLKHVLTRLFHLTFE